MSNLPDPRKSARPEVLAEIERMGALRSNSSGRAELGAVYLALFNNPDLAVKVGNLGEAIRFDGILPDATRETAILRFAGLTDCPYIAAHHRGPAARAGVAPEVIEELGSGLLPAGLDPSTEAVVMAVGQVIRGERLEQEVQASIEEAFGVEGLVEVVVLCGLYGIMKMTVDSFGVAVEADISD